MLTSELDPVDLLAGPRGRRLCLELAQRADDDVARRVFYAAHDLDPGAGTSRVVMFGPGAAGRPQASPQDVADEISRAALPTLNDLTLMQALDVAVATARYWQEPDGEDVLAATPTVRAALEHVARGVVAAPAARWWTTALDTTAQCRVSWAEDGRPPRPPDPDPAAALAAWRAEAVTEEETAARERPTDPAAPWSGVWWSTPPSVIPRTSRDLGSLGPVGLMLVEDSLGWERALVTAVDVPASARVLEIDGPDVWAQLCRRHPLPVASSRRHDWYRATGRGDVTWVQPDWAGVADEVDAVHLTVAGYLTTAGRAIPIGQAAASVLAGWDPDATYWLTDRPTAVGPPRGWSLDRSAGMWVVRE